MGKITGFMEFRRLQEASEAPEARKQHYHEFIRPLADDEAAVQGARDSVRRTPELLKTLRDAGVVDAGGAGYLLFVGALLFWVMTRRNEGKPGTRGHAIWVDGLEPICAGLISGSALVGIGNAVVNVLL